MASIGQEFKDFISRGNLVDLAIGVVVGTAFAAITTSLVNDIIMPPVGLLLGNVDFANLFVALDGGAYESLAAAQEAGAPTLNYGLFVNTVINFLIVAFVMFLVIRQVNRIEAARQAGEDPAAPTEKTCPYCKSPIPVEATRCKFCTSSLDT